MVNDPLRRVNCYIANSILSLDPIRLKNHQPAMVVAIYHSAHSLIHAFRFHQYPLPYLWRQ